MPELPEVETIVRGLNKLLPGKTVSKVDFDWPKGFPNSKNDVEAFLLGSSVERVRRRGKLIIMELDSGYSLLTHLKMTGQLVYVSRLEKKDKRSKIKDGAIRFGGGHPSGSLNGHLPDKSTRVTITFSDQSKLYFNDQRKFGWMKLMPSNQVSDLPSIKKMGPEPLDDSFQFTVFSLQLNKRKNSTIKAALLDQTVVAGIGNIYADESLWGARIHPATLVKDVSQIKLKELFKEIKYVLQLSIQKGGSTDRNYIDAEGKKGSYLKFARVFRRQGQPCPRCGRAILKTRVASRGTHFCPHCQKYKEPKK